MVKCWFCTALVLNRPVYRVIYLHACQKYHRAPWVFLINCLSYFMLLSFRIRVGADALFYDSASFLFAPIIFYLNGWFKKNSILITKTVHFEKIYIFSHFRFNWHKVYTYILWIVGWFKIMLIILIFSMTYNSYILLWLQNI